MDSNTLKIHSINVRNFRSIDHLFIEKLTDWNVFVGANNAGKSSVLLALYEALRSFADRVIAVRSRVGNVDFDYHKSQTELPIEVAVYFQNDSTELVVCLKVERFKIDVPHLLASAFSTNKKERAISYISSIELNGKSLFQLASEEVAALASIELLLNWRLTLQSLQLRAKGKYAPLFVFLDDDRLWKHAWRLFCEDVDIDGDDPDLEDELKQLFVQSGRNNDERINQAVASATSVLTGAAPRSNADFLPPIKVAGDVARLEPAEAKAGEVISMLRKSNVFAWLGSKAFSSSDADALMSMKNQRQFIPKFRELTQHINEVTLDAVNVFQNEDGSASIDLGHREAPFAGLGVGHTAKLLFDLSVLRPGSFVLLEEPETHSHPDLLIRLMARLEQFNHQFFITTHASLAVPTSPASSLYLLSKELVSDNTKAVRIETGEQSMILKELGLGLKSLFLEEVCVLVEGKSDELILRRLAELLEIKLQATFVQLEGSGNVKHFAVARMLEFLTARGSRICFILDQDERNSEAVQKLERQIGTTAKTVVLEKRELENYLLVPRALAEAISKRVQNNQTLPIELTETTVATMLNEAANNNRHVAVNKRIDDAINASTRLTEKRPDCSKQTAAFLSETRRQMQDAANRLNEVASNLEAYQSATQREVDSDWDAKKLDRVPGAEILSDVYKKAGLSYKKVNDGLAIVNELRLSDVDPFLVQTLRQIANM